MQVAFVPPKTGWNVAGVRCSPGAASIKPLMGGGIKPELLRQLNWAFDRLLIVDPLRDGIDGMGKVQSDNGDVESGGAF